MKVQTRIPSPPFHSHAHHTGPASQNHAQAHANGVHSDPSRPRHSASTTDHLNGDDMSQYLHSYGAGNGNGNGYAQQQYQQHPQQRQYAPQNQLPPMHSNMMPPSMGMQPPSQSGGQGIPGTSNGVHPVLYPAAIAPAGLPQPGARALEAQNNVSPTKQAKL